MKECALTLVSVLAWAVLLPVFAGLALPILWIGRRWRETAFVLVGGTVWGVFTWWLFK